MKREIFKLEEKQCYLYTKDEPQCTIIQPVDENGVKALDRQAEFLVSQIGSSFAFTAFTIEDWNNELSPWPAPAVFGRDGFGGGAGKTLDYIMGKLLPAVSQRLGIEGVPVIIGGYSLAALFSLWCGYQTESFLAVAAASPSVWFPGWLSYITENSVKARHVYLSLGDKEEKTKNKTMQAVGSNIRLQHQILVEEGTETVLKWNDGNHFKDIDIRCADAFAWCVQSAVLGQCL